MSETQPTADGVLTVPGPRGGLWRRMGVWPRRIAIVLLVLFLWPIVMTLVYTVVPPPVSNVMITRLMSGNGLDRDWVSLIKFRRTSRAPS